MLETHKCPIAGCSSACPRHHAMCLPHWRMVPAQLQRVVYGAWRRLQKWETQYTVKDHRDAIEAAVSTVNMKLQAKDAKKPKNQGNLLQE